MTRRVDLVADGIENPGNAEALVDAARMFGSHCRYRLRGHSADPWCAMSSCDEDVSEITRDELAAQYSPIVALENLSGARCLYGYRLADAARPAMIVGNERRGIAHDLQSAATHDVEIPLASQRLNCLNVAAAAAIGLYYLSRGGGKLQARPEPARKRPELLFVGPGDHVELGSSLRSACALGWGRVFVEDRDHKWFASDRVTRSEGRGAARRGRNAIHVVPARSDQRYGFGEACILTTRRLGKPLHRANLAVGHQQIIAIPDESMIDVRSEDWERLGKVVNLVHLDLAGPSFAYRYRLITAIALAEAARQIGRKERRGQPGRPDLRYDSAFDLLLAADGEVITLDELAAY